MAAMTPLVLAVDGGNSKTDVLLADVAGDVLGFVRGPGSSPHVLGVPGTVALLADLVRAVRARAGVPPQVRFARAEVYLAGADLPVEVAALHAALAELGWADQLHLDNDTFALLRAGTEAPDAAVVVCGAGINAAARTADGRTARFPSLGWISGDWGGGEHLGQEVVWHAARAEDGRGPASLLVGAVTGHFGLPSVAEVSAAVHLGTLPATRLDELCPALFACAAGGDAVAGGVVTRLVDEIAVLARVALDRLSLLAAPVTVVLGGGVIRAQRAALVDGVADRLRQWAPQAEVAVVTDPPVLGAALAGLDALGAGRTAHDALRVAVRGLAPSGSPDGAVARMIL